MQFENISIHCENGHIVQSCEITATVAPSAVTLSSRSTYTTYLCFSWLKQSLSMVIIVVLSEININFCGYLVVFCIKMVELRTLAWTDIVSGNVYSTIYFD